MELKELNKPKIDLPKIDPMSSFYKTPKARSNKTIQIPKALKTEPSEREKPLMLFYFHQQASLSRSLIPNKYTLSQNSAIEKVNKTLSLETWKSNDYKKTSAIEEEHKLKQKANSDALKDCELRKTPQIRDEHKGHLSEDVPKSNNSLIEFGSKRSPQIDDANKYNYFLKSQMNEEDQRNTDFTTWKGRKIEEIKSKKDFGNYLMKKDTKIRKLHSQDPKKTMNSSLNNVNFKKLNEIKVETLPKAQISEEKLTENLKEFIGINKYPIDYNEIHFEAPKASFIKFEPLKTHMSNFKQSFEKTGFEEQLMGKFHRSQSNFMVKNNDLNMPRRDMIGLAQWLDKASAQIFEVDGLTPDEQLSNIQKLYTQCISELADILSKECQERGSLLSSIWNTHTLLVNACLTRLESEKTSQYSSFLSEIERIKDSYAQCFETLSKENKEKITMLEERDHLIKKLNYDNTGFKRKEGRLKKTVQSLGDAINELKDMFDSVLAENIKLKLSKEEEHNLHRGEREILKRQYDDLLKSKNNAKNGIFMRVEKLLKQKTFAHSPSKEIHEAKSFAFDLEMLEASRDTQTFGTLKDIVLKDISEENEEVIDLDAMGELFTKEASVDTSDLLPVNNKETSTKDLMRYYSREASAQTVYFDEINDEGEDGVAVPAMNMVSPPVIGRMRTSLVTGVGLNGMSIEQMVESKRDFKGSPSLDKSLTLRRRMFSFSAESLNYLQKFNEIQSYTLTGICEWYSKELNCFFDFLRHLTDNLEAENFGAVLEKFDWLNFAEAFRNICIVHEQFIKNIKNRDTTRSKEILQHKIELLERKIEMDEAEKMRNMFQNNYKKLREKFEEFYKMTIKIQIMNEEEENISPSLPQAEETKNVKRRKSLTLIAENEDENFMEKMKNEFKRKKGKTTIKSKLTIIKPQVVKRSNEEEKENTEESLHKSKSSQIRKFQDIPDKPLEVKKVTHFSIKKTTFEEKDKEHNSNSASIEIKPPSNENSAVPNKRKSIEFAESFSDFKNLEEEEKNQNPPLKSFKSGALNTNDQVSKTAYVRSGKKEKTAKIMEASSYISRNMTVESQFDVKGTLEKLDKEKNDVMRLEEKKMKEQQEFKDVIANENMINLINQANNVLPQKKSWDKINSVNADKCYAFLHRIEVSEIGLTKNVTLSTILKTISQLFTELIKLKYKKPGNLNPLFFILYEFLMQRYGNNRERAESKMIKIFQGCKSHLDLPRVRNFARLLSILPADKKDALSTTSDGNDLDFYLNYFMLLDDCPMSNIPGIMLAMSPQESAVTALAKALEILSKFCGNYPGLVPRIKQESYINQIKAVKLDDPIVSRKYVVDVDFVIEKFFEIRDEVFKIYRIPFLAVDLDYNDALNINEFLLLVRNIERNKYPEKKIIELFMNEYDFYDEEKEEKCMSFKRFAFVCEREKIIGLKKQEELVQNVSDDIRTLKQLKDEWDVKKNLIKLKLIKTNYYNSFYVRALKLIEAFLNSKSNQEEENKIIWFRYRIMEEESTTLLLQFETESCLPKALNLLSMKAGELL